ncbi:hypothetical protein D3C71_1789320 [compost metagenome]
MLQQATGHPGRIDQQSAACRYRAEGLANLAVIAHLDAIDRQHLTQMFIHLVATDEQRRLLAIDQRERYEDRVVGHIAATQIE